MKKKNVTIVRPGFAVGILLATFTLMVAANSVSVEAAGFTDIFYTNSFRGSFEWFKKMDWLGMVVQAVISVFSLVGVSLIVIRIMTSMLYLSAKGLWEEVHEMKQSGGESELYDFGLVGMAKNWAKGKNGYTGLDAIMGAILTLLPDVKRYSDFGEKSGQKFDEDTSISQYMLKIALPTVLAVFFLAMGFNGTLVKGLATTVDAMGTIADHAVSVNYAGFIDDLIDSKTGYKFTAANAGTEEGKFVSAIQNQVYGKVVAKIRGVDEAQLYAIGQAIEDKFGSDDIEGAVSNSPKIDDSVKGYLANTEEGDHYWSLIDAQVEVGGSEGGDGTLSYAMSELLAGVNVGGISAEAGSYGNQYVTVYFGQNATSPNNYFNIGGVSGSSTAIGPTGPGGGGGQ